MNSGHEAGHMYSRRDLLECQSQFPISSKQEAIYDILDHLSLSQLLLLPLPHLLSQHPDFLQIIPEHSDKLQFQLLLSICLLLGIIVRCPWLRGFRQLFTIIQTVAGSFRQHSLMEY